MGGRPQIWTREEIVTGRTLRRSIGVAVALVLLISNRIDPRALELF
jgi:hypothetical protein